MVRKISVLAIAFAGVIHLVLAPQHYSHAPAHGIFFAIVGLIEILWAIAYWRHPSTWLYYLGIAIAGGLIVLWIVTRFAPAPFENEPGSLDAWGILCKVSELAGFVALVSLTAPGQIAGTARIYGRRVILTAITLALLCGIAFYGLGFAAQPLFPALVSHEHSHEENAGNQHEASEGEATHAVGEEHLLSSDRVENTRGIRVEDAWARPATSGQNGAVYFTIQNLTARDDRLLGVSTDIAQSAEMHLTEIDANGVASMSPQKSVNVSSQGMVEFKPGGLHVMLVGLTRDLKKDDTFSITLSFERAGGIIIQVNVKVK